MWMNASFLALGSKGSSSWCKELYFWHPTLLRVCLRKQLFLRLTIPQRVQVMWQCSPLRIFTNWQHSKWLKKKRRGKWSSYLFSHKFPKCSIKTVWSLEDMCCWSVGISLITSAVGWTTELPPAALLRVRSNTTAPTC